jgi:Ca-activated chloride channel homolog
LTPEKASEVLVQWSKRDHIVVIPFNGYVINTWEGSGEATSQAELLANVQQVSADGGTDMYSCVRKASEMLRPLLAKNDNLPAIVIMTDGRSEGSADQFLSGRAAEDQRIPIFGITFGNADKSQLDTLAKATGGRVFDGTKDLASAFRSVRGYN